MQLMTLSTFSEISRLDNPSIQINEVRVCEDLLYHYSIDLPVSCSLKQYYYYGEIFFINNTSWPLFCQPIIQVCIQCQVFL